MTANTHTHGPGGERARTRRDRRRTTPAAVLAGALVLPLLVTFPGPDLLTRQTFGVGVFALLAIGLTLGVLPRGRPSGSALAVAAALLAFAAWTAVGATWAESPERAVTEFGRLLTYGGVLALALAAVNARSWRGAALGLSGAVLVLTAAALASRLIPGVFAGSPAGLGAGFERLSYPLGYWNGVAVLAAAATSILLLWASVPPARGVRPLALALMPAALLVVYLTYSRAGFVLVALGAIGVLLLGAPPRRTFAAAAAAALAAAAVIAVARSQPAIADGTGGRGGWIVVAALLICGVLLYRLEARLPAVRGRKQRGYPGRPGIAASAIAAVAVLIVVAGLSSEVGSRAPEAVRSPAQAPRDPSVRLLRLNDERSALWASALDAFAGRPLGGIGAGSFELWWMRDSGGENPVRDAHSLYLEVLAETGIVGFVLLLAVLAAAGVTLIRAQRRFDGTRRLAAGGPLLLVPGLIAIHATVDWDWEVAPLMVLAFAAVGIAAAARTRPRPPQNHHPLAIGAAVALAVASAAALVPGLVSFDRSGSARQALAAGDPREAFGFADQAVTAAPWSAEAHALRALAAAELGRVDRAGADVRAAIDREPENPRWLVVLAAIERRAGNDEAAEAALDRARDLTGG